MAFFFMSAGKEVFEATFPGGASLGFDKMDHRIISTIIEKFGSPVGVCLHLIADKSL